MLKSTAVFLLHPPPPPSQRKAIRHPYNTSMPRNCACGKQLTSFDLGATDAVRCNGCDSVFAAPAKAYSCRQCNFDLCACCHQGSRVGGGTCQQCAADTSKLPFDLRFPCEGCRPTRLFQLVMANSPLVNCPARHGLRMYSTPTEGFGCDVCSSRCVVGTLMASCRECDFDVCLSCAVRGSVAAAPAAPRAIPFSSPIMSTGWPQPSVGDGVSASAAAPTTGFK